MDSKILLFTLSIYTTEYLYKLYNNYILINHRYFLNILEIVDNVCIVCGWLALMFNSINCFNIYLIFMFNRYFISFLYSIIIFLHFIINNIFLNYKYDYITNSNLIINIFNIYKILIIYNIHTEFFNYLNITSNT